MTNKEIAAAGLAAFTRRLTFSTCPAGLNVDIFCAASQRDIPFEEREGLTLEQAKRMLMAAVASKLQLPRLPQRICVRS